MLKVKKFKKEIVVSNNPKAVYVITLNKPTREFLIYALASEKQSNQKHKGILLTH